MKLPDIEYGPVQTASAAPAAVGEAAQRTASVFAAGFTALGQEMIKTQAQKASVDLHTGLARLEEDLTKSRYISAADVRQRLGPDFDSLPPAVRSQLTRRVQDPSTGDTVEVDREDVPTWLVAGAIYRKEAKELARSASQNISAPGWQAEFEASASKDIAERQGKFALVQAHAMVEDQKLDQIATVDQLVRLKAYDRALSDVESSKALTPGEKAKLREHVLQKKQQDTSLDKVFGAAVAAAQETRPNGEVDVERAQTKLDATPDLTGEERVKAQAILEDRTRQATAAYHQALGDRVLAAKVAWERGDPKRGIAPYTDPRISVPQDLQDYLQNKQHPGGPDAWEQLLGWHQLFVNRERANAQLPTQAQVATAATLEADIVRDAQTGGKLYKSMTPGQFVQTWLVPEPGKEPKLTPAQFDKVFQVFLAAQSKQPGQPGIIDAKAILLEELPGEWKPTPRQGGPNPKNPETWAQNTREWAAWVDLSEDLDGWLRSNPGADAKAIREHVKTAVATRAAEKMRERSWTLGKPSSAYGFEVRRRSDLDARNYQPDETAEPAKVPGVPDDQVQGIKDALKRKGLAPNAQNITDMWNSRPGAAAPSR